MAAATLPWFAFFALFGPVIWLVLAGCDALVLMLVGLRRRRDRAQIRAGVARAYPLWRDAWYCYRCDVVWRREEEAAFMSPARFQREVWARGGYDDLIPLPPR
ncbi:hypothetical protein [Streptomyces lomondensis]|uniref:hypothetical protein n=1 Tax=Streptomyces lomondensis TaxID=68229 RepID=UPI0016793F8B|nr:hypothetical protein [Streptomyces lomondensis]MCF0078219.1 hypothetical protein [Streptomyces lomondensis]